MSHDVEFAIIYRSKSKAAAQACADVLGDRLKVDTALGKRSGVHTVAVPRAAFVRVYEALQFWGMKPATR